MRGCGTDMLKKITVALCIILIFLSYKFWIGSDSILQVLRLKKAIAVQQAEIATLKNRNQELVIKVNNIKKHPLIIEERARYELGMIKRGEKYYQVVEPIQ